MGLSLGAPGAREVVTPLNSRFTFVTQLIITQVPLSDSRFFTGRDYNSDSVSVAFAPGLDPSNTNLHA